MRYVIWLFFILLSFTYANDDFKLQIFNDKTSMLKIEEVANRQFVQSSKNNFNLGYKDGTIWFKFNLTNHDNEEEFILSLNETFYEVANLYHYDKKWIKKENSLSTPIKDRKIKSNHLAFDVTLDKNQTKEFYLELKAKYAYFGKVSLYEWGDFYYKTSRGINILYTFVLGIFLSIVLFTLFLFMKTREKIYFYYGGYSFFNSIFFLNTSGLLVYIDLQRYIYELLFASAFAMGFLVLFSKEYLEIPKHLKEWDKVFTLLSILFFILGVLVFFSCQPWNKFINNLSGLLGLMLIFTSIIIYFKGNLKTKYYIFAIILYFTFIFLFTFMINGVLEYTNITRYGLVVANAIEVIIFSLILANRYHMINENNKQFLEKEVFNRTSELNLLLKQKELLLKEVHHRVKNNFHMLIGMLHLENLKSGENIDLTSLANRVLSMSTIHEYLHKSKDISNINIKDYLEKIILNIKKSCPKCNISYHIQNNTKINSSDAQSLGIIINEVLTNAIKHNMKTTNLIIIISLLDKDDKIHLTIKDNGKGFNKDYKKGIGLKLVEQLCDKLPNATHSLTFESGIKFQLNFSKSENNEKH